ncbi:MAG: metallophosphoesterase [Gammaproteobacteria bacterium]|nr:metallophosphoesterase [Gammaproteobacteria bacterium]
MSQTFGININIFNNIIIGTGARSVLKIDYRSLVTDAELHMDNNLYWNVDGSSPTLIWKDKLGDTAVSFSEWVARSGVDQNSLATDPLFVNVSGGDYRLSDNSPALDVGADLSTDVPKDFANTPRPQGSGWDIGAFESSVGLTVSSGGTTGTGGGAAGGGGSVVADISGLATEMPTAAGKPILRRYPYIQGFTSDHLKVIWGTENPGKATITYRKLSDSNFQTVIAVSTSNSRSYFYQKADLIGLQADTQYVYNLYHNDVLLVKEMTFKTLPDTNANGVSFLVIGDSGTRYSQPRGVRDQMSRKDSTGNFYYPHDFIVGVGDLAYSSTGFIDGVLQKLDDGTPETFDFNFFDLMSGKANVASLNPAEVSILSRRPFFGTLGNHEYGNNASNIPTGFTESFEFPVMMGIPPEDAEHYYSFDVGNAHFIMLDTEKFVPRDPAVLRLPAMLAWLEADLQASTKPWKMAFFHHSIFSSGKHGYAADKRENVDMRKKLSTLFQQYGVKLVLFGHEHASQRSVPLKVDGATGRIVRNADGSIDQTNGVTYVLSGHGGKDHHQRETSPTIPNTPEWDKQVRESGVGHDFTATNVQTGEPVLFDDPRRNQVSGQTDQPEFPLDRWGFVHVVVEGNTVRVGSYNRSGDILDEFTLN